MKIAIRVKVIKRSSYVLAGIVLLVLASGECWGTRSGGREALATVKEHSLMKPDLKTLKEWIKAHRSAPQIFIDQKRKGMSSFVPFLDLSSHLLYAPSQRDQGSCGNCWVWAGTGIMEIAHSVQNGVKDRLSIQYINSCYANNGEYACCGGWLENLVSVYLSSGMAIPWSNPNAHFQDANRVCEDRSSLISCSEILTSPSYPLVSISNVSIQTYQVGQATAIANIKSVLNQDKAVWFGFFLSNNDDWKVFFDFWDYQSEDDVFSFDYASGHDWLDEEGGGHAVLIVGYNEESPTPYWIALNSWGTTPDRPRGIFRIAMNMDYDNYCIYLDEPDQNLFFETLDVHFAGETSTTTTVPLCPVELLYGELSEEAEILRSLKDTIFSRTPEGQELIRLYYRLSPAIVQIMEDDRRFKLQIEELIEAVVQLSVKQDKI